MHRIAQGSRWLSYTSPATASAVARLLGLSRRSVTRAFERAQQLSSPRTALEARRARQVCIQVFRRCAPFAPTSPPGNEMCGYALES